MALNVGLRPKYLCNNEINIFCLYALISLFSVVQFLGSALNILANYRTRKFAIDNTAAHKYFIKLI